MKNIIIENNSNEIASFRWPLTKLLEKINPGDKIKLTTDSSEYYSKAIENLNDVNIIEEEDGGDDYPNYFQSGNDLTITLKDHIDPSLYQEFKRAIGPAMDDVKIIYDYYDLYKDDIDMPEDYEGNASLTPEEKARIKEHKEEYRRLNNENTKKFDEIINAGDNIYTGSDDSYVDLTINIMAPVTVIEEENFYAYITDDTLLNIQKVFRYINYTEFDVNEYSTEGWYRFKAEEAEQVEDKDLMRVPIEKVSNLTFTIKKCVMTLPNALNDQNEAVKIPKQKLVPYCDNIVTDNEIKYLQFTYRHLDEFVDKGICSIELFEEGKETFDDRLDYFNPYRHAEGEVIYEYVKVPAKSNVNYVTKLSYDDPELGDPIRIVVEIGDEITEENQIIEVDFSSID